MRKSHFTIVLLCVWLFSFLFCLLVPLFRRQNIPENFSNLIKEAFDTFGPSLASMVAFIYAREQATLKNFWGDKFQSTDLLALTLSVIYVGMFDVIMALFLFRKNNAEETVQLFQQYRP
ncbi:MAG TPA: hypothetical protein VGN86_07885, partial [Pyrinomonadaceae bacterium]|nr:hypothetical protein [Pyrinomonadaceae bacterium]